MKLTSRPSGAIAPRWSQFAIRPVGSSSDGHGLGPGPPRRRTSEVDHALEPLRRRRGTACWTRCSGRSRPLGRRRTAFVRRRRADVVRHRHDAATASTSAPPSGESARRTDHRQAALGLGVEQRLAGERLAVDPERARRSGGRRRGRVIGAALSDPAPAVERRLERRHRLGPGPAAVGRAAQLDRQVVGVLAAPDAVA